MYVCMHVSVSVSVSVCVNHEKVKIAKPCIMNVTINRSKKDGK